MPSNHSNYTRPIFWIVSLAAIVGMMVAHKELKTRPAPDTDQRYQFIARSDEVRRLPPPTPAVKPRLDPNFAYSVLIRRFNAKTNDQAVARESAGLVKLVHPAAQPTCLLIAMITHKNIGDLQGARRFAEQLNQLASGWDLPGIPREAHDWATVEDKDVTPIIELLHSLQIDNPTMSHTNALASLVAQYSERRDKLQRSASTQP
jgi:hypothetical protein